MVWTNKKFDRDAVTEFLPPPTWLTWCGYEYDNTNRTYEYVEVEGTHLDGSRYTFRQRNVLTDETPPKEQWQGKIRHHHDLFTARKHVGYTGATNRFHGEWRIYEWVDGEWVLRYEGHHGDAKDQHPLFQQQLKNPNAKARKTKKQIEREKREAEEREVLASIARDMERSAS